MQCVSRVQCQTDFIRQLSSPKRSQNIYKVQYSKTPEIFGNTHVTKKIQYNCMLSCGRKIQPTEID